MNTPAKAANFAAKIKIADILPVGREHAITTKELCELYGVDMRELRKRIADERKAGAVICSDTSARGGYYAPADRGEIEACVRTLDAKARAIFAALKSARGYLKNTVNDDSDQMTIDTQSVRAAKSHGRTAYIPYRQRVRSAEANSFKSDREKPIFRG